MESFVSLLPLAFIGGVLMFLAPCTLPLVPAFLASLAPRVQSTRTQQSMRGSNHVHLYAACMFTVGFTIVFVLFGLLAGYLGSSVTTYKTLLGQIGGLFIIVFGLGLLDVYRVRIFSQSFLLSNTLHVLQKHPRTPILLGAIFALGWVPCAGPVLASILILTSQSSTTLEGGVLLFIFSLGLAIPFILTGFLYSRAYGFIVAYDRYANAIRYASGTFLILLGTMLVFGQYILMTHWGFTLYSFLGYTPMCTYF